MTQIVLQPYTRFWRWQFFKEKLLLTLVCGTAVNFQHVGSTAIRGMVAKPIIDILVGFPSVSEALWFKRRIQRLGYEFHGENSELRQHYYVKGSPEAMHLYIVELSGETWSSRLAFRDYLRSHPDYARRYAELKIGLAEQYATDLRSYQNGKAAFIKEIVLKAYSNSHTQARVVM